MVGQIRHGEKKMTIYCTTNGCAEIMGRTVAKTLRRLTNLAQMFSGLLAIAVCVSLGATVEACYVCGWKLMRLLRVARRANLERTAAGALRGITNLAQLSLGLLAIVFCLTVGVTVEVFYLGGRKLMGLLPRRAIGHGTTAQRPIATSPLPRCAVASMPQAVASQAA